MRIWLDPTKLAARQLTAADVVSALQEQNVEIPAGQLGRPPSNPKQDFQMTLRVIGRLSDPREFEQHHPEEHPQRNRSVEGCWAAPRSAPRTTIPT